MIYVKGCNISQRQSLELKQKIASEIVPHEIKDIIEDIHKLLQAIHEIVGHIEQTLHKKICYYKNFNRCPIIT